VSVKDSATSSHWVVLQFAAGTSAPAARLPDGQVALSQRLTTALASAVGPRLVPQTGRAFTVAGDSYTPAGGDAVVEVVAGTTRHAVVTVVRLR
jgi:hypothetical protein